MSFEADAASWSVVVLTGGASRRMGSDKATLVVDGLTLLERTLSGVPDDVSVVVAGPEVALPAAGRRRVTFAMEKPPGGGPVAGLDAALAHVSTAVVVVLATDLPFVGHAPGVLAARLLGPDAGEPGAGEAVDAVLAADGSGRGQQLCAAYRTTALRAAIADGGPPAGAAMRSVVARLHVVVADVGIGEATWDVDTPDDIARMTALLRGDDPEPQSR